MNTYLQRFLVLATTAAAGSASAQMYVAPLAAADPSANIYFGSAKDTTGNLLSDVTVSVDTEATTYIVVSDEIGRFKIAIPKDITPPEATFKCSKPGYVQLRATRRYPPRKATSPIQADCVLKRVDGPK